MLYSNTKTVQIAEFPEISHLLNQHHSSLARHVNATSLKSLEIQAWSISKPRTYVLGDVKQIWRMLTSCEWQFSMGKRNCCVPTCVNSWRNSPGVNYHTFPKDKAVCKEYKRLIRNDNLKEFSANTRSRICGNHFPGGERMSRTQLPSIFPWSNAPSKIRREKFKHDLPAKRKNISVDFEAVANTSTVLSAEVRPSDPIIVNEVSSSGGDVDCGVSRNTPVDSK